MTCPVCRAVPETEWVDGQGEHTPKLTVQKPAFMTDKCALCPNGFTLNEKRYLSCGHTVHKTCIYRRHKTNTKCPVCLKKYSRKRFGLGKPVLTLQNFSKDIQLVEDNLRRLGQNRSSKSKLRRATVSRRGSFHISRHEGTNRRSGDRSHQPSPAQNPDSSTSKINRLEKMGWRGVQEVTNRVSRHRGARRATPRSRRKIRNRICRDGNGEEIGLW